jgi:hypothetical protein
VSKRDGAPAPHVKVLAEQHGSNYPPGRMLVASPSAVAAELASVPPGRVITLPVLRARLALRFGADYTCPITTGIFLRIVSEAAVEEGRADDVPVWRVVRENGACLDTLPGGPLRQAERLCAEGVTTRRQRTAQVVENLHAVSVPVTGAG